MAIFSQPPPGSPLDKDLVHQVREKFIAKFVQSEMRHLPFWFSLPMNPVSKEIFNNPEFLALPQAYFMVGKGKRITSAGPHEIRLFFERQKPSEDFDLYVFDESFSWCIASTHESAQDAVSDQDFLILQKGAIPTHARRLSEMP